MITLAFETSCDDTSVAIVNDMARTLSCVRHSQIVHQNWGGVVPELAAREHSQAIFSVLEMALQEFRVLSHKKFSQDFRENLEDIDFISVTRGPGLGPSLLSGTHLASFLSVLGGIPVISVDHIFGHVSSVFLERNLSSDVFPALILTVSGGHTQLIYQTSFTQFRLLGETRDDAVGEVFDKVARAMGLGYPGGPIVSRYAEQGNIYAYDFPKIFLKKKSLEFSFSGLKSAVLREIESVSHLKKQDISNICASFQKTVADTFIQKVIWAHEQFPVQSLHFVGGVSANTFLCDQLSLLCEDRGIDFRTPIKNIYSTDNAAMIGLAGIFQHQSGEIPSMDFVDMVSRSRINFSE